MERDFEARLNSALAQTSANQAEKEKALRESAEADKIKALEEIQRQ